MFDAPFGERIALVLGNEGSGVTDALLAVSPVHVTVPMPGAFESLNVAAAAAVCLYERVRRRSGAR